MKTEDHIAQIRALLKDAVPMPNGTQRIGREVLSVVPTQPRPHTADAITRDSHLQRIRYLARAYRLRWLVEQATFDRPGLDNLEDWELVQLHRDMDRAMDCIRDGIAFDDAGLVRAQG